MDNLSISDPKITLVEEEGKRHSQVEILDTRIGVLTRPSARIFQPLYEEQLAVHISGDAGMINLLFSPTVTVTFKLHFDEHVLNNPIKSR